MANYAIMRCAKLKTLGSVAASLQHNFRERETLNADASKTPDNEHLITSTTDKAMGMLRDKLPEKRRKDAVVVVEYLLTTSPEWAKNASEDDQKRFFERSMRWLQDKYGNENIIAATIQRDETTPHLSAFVVPITRDGRLSAKEYIGNKSKMSADQDTFAKAVLELGLERGVKGSKAKHQKISQYYARVNDVKSINPQVMDDLLPKITKKGLLGTHYEDSEAVAKRVLNSHIKPLEQKVDSLRNELEIERMKSNTLNKMAAVIPKNINAQEFNFFIKKFSEEKYKKELMAERSERKEKELKKNLKPYSIDR